MQIVQGESLWTEKYRPQCVADCVLPERIKKAVIGALREGQFQHMLFAGTGGCGKTTLAKALCNELKIDYIIINASEENGIDVLRNKIRSYASAVSLSGDYKVVILDEADYLTPQTQGALRGFLEEFSNNCRFIFTCNFKNRIIEPLHSRCTVIEFSTSRSELAELSLQFMKRLKIILKSENVPFNDKVIAELIMKFAPDWRRTLNEIQRLSRAHGEINSSALVSISDSTVARLIDYLRDKDFRSMRKWVVENLDMDSTAMFRAVYDILNERAVPESIPQAVLIIAEYSYKNSFVADREINIVAAFVELAANVNWK